MEEGKEGFCSPDKILEQLDIRDRMKVADFGCGHGYFSISLAKKVPNGQVYAIDVVEDALEAVQSKAKLEEVSSIETVHANLEILGSSKLEDQSIDLVLLRNILFQSEKKEEILKEANRILKNGGKMVLIEWAIDSPLAPKEGLLLSKENAHKLVSALGPILEKELKIDNHHYGLVFKK